MRPLPARGQSPAAEQRPSTATRTAARGCCGPAPPGYRCRGLREGRPRLPGPLLHDPLCLVGEGCGGQDCGAGDAAAAQTGAASLPLPPGGRLQVCLRGLCRETSPLFAGPPSRRRAPAQIAAPLSGGARPGVRLVAPLVLGRVALRNCGPVER